MSKVHGVCVHKTIKCYCTISLIVDKSCFTALCYSMVTNFGTRWRSIFYLLHLILHQRYVLHSPLPTATTATTCRVGHPLRKLWQVKASLLVNVEKSIWKSCFFCCVGWTWTRGSSTCRPPEPMWSLLTGAIGNWRMVCLACCTTSVRTLAERFDFNWWI